MSRQIRKSQPSSCCQVVITVRTSMSLAMAGRSASFFYHRSHCQFSMKVTQHRKQNTHLHTTPPDFRPRHVACMSGRCTPVCPKRHWELLLSFSFCGPTPHSVEVLAFVVCIKVKSWTGHIGMGANLSHDTSIPRTHYMLMKNIQTMC